MKITEQIKADHRQMAAILDVLDAICNRLSAGEPVGLDHLEAIMLVIQLYGGQAHTVKEEAVLFPAMEAVGIPREGEIGMIEQEHAMGNTFVDQMQSAFQRYQAGDADAIESFVDNARWFMGLVAMHMEKEEALISMAAERFSEEQQRELLGAFERVVTERVGVEEMGELERSLVELKRIYLGDSPGS